MESTKITLTLLWTKSGCIRCDDFRNAGLYNKLEDLVEYSLESNEGIVQSILFGMWGRNGVETPCLYIGDDLDSPDVSENPYTPSTKNKRYYGENVKVYLELL